MRSNEGDKGHRSDYEGRKGGTGQNRSKGSAHGQVLASDEELTRKVRSGRDKHPQQSGKGNYA